MSDVRRRYAIRFELENGNLVKAQMETLGKDGKKSLEEIEKGARSADQRLGALSQTILKRVVPALSVGGLAAASRKAISDLADIESAAKKLRVSIDQLQEARFFGKDAGLDSGASDAMFADFIKRVGEARDGLGDLYPVLEQYNIKVRDNTGATRDWKDIMADVASAVSVAGSEQEKFAIAGAAGLTNFIGVLEQGPEKIRALGTEARESGILIDKHLINQATEFDAAWKRVQDQFSAGWKSAILTIGVELRALYKKITGELSPTDELNVLAAKEARVRHLGKDPAFETHAEIRLKQIEQRRREIMSSPEYEQEAWDKFKADWEREAERLENYRLRKPNGNVPPVSGGSAGGNDGIKESIRLADQEREKVERVIEALQFKTEQMGRDALQQEIHNQLRQAGVDLYSEEGRRIADLVRGHYEYEQAQERVAQAATLVGDSIRGTAMAFQDLRTYALNTLADIAEAMVKLQFGGQADNSIGGLIAQGISGLFANTGSGYDAAVSAPPPKPKFAGGGRFMVGGQGGTDSQMVQFWASPDERVTVETPAQQRANTPPVNVNIVNNSNAQIESRRSGTGGRDLEVVISETTGKSIRSGRLDSAMAARYGLRPAAG
jgi:hypothetical protein